MDFNIIKNKFFELFNTRPLLVRSPGRINLIGEHTDYNNGFVLPAAINKEIILALATNNTNKCRLYSFDYNEFAEFDLSSFKPSKTGWANYIMGVVDQLQKAGHEIKGFDCVFGGDIPIGAGLSSSAALECGAAFALSKLFKLEISRENIIHYAQKAEHEFAGVQCGIMDQFASTMGKERHAIRLDCRSLEHSYFPLNFQDYQVLLFDTQVKHSLASSEYNTRRQECEAGVAAVQEKYPQVKSLRDVNLKMLQEVKDNLDPVVYKRCLYIIEENERLLSGCSLLEKGDIAGFGAKMYGSHEGLSMQYEVSCPELDFLVDFTKDKEYVIGSRMMGGGFGGCTINLVAADKKEELIENISSAYKSKFGRELQPYEVLITDGSSLQVEE
jgi:galactokinase